MRVRVEDEDALRSPSARDIRLYLQMQNWARQEPTNGPTVWELPTDEGTYEVISPSSREAPDYTARVAELLRTLSIAEERSELEILRDLSSISFDVQYVRLQAQAKAGTAPLKDAAEALAAMYSVYTASAVSLEYPKPVLPITRPPDVKSILDKVLAGPTSGGSYVISVWMPIPPRLSQQEDGVLFDPGENPHERTVTLQVNRAIAETREAAQSVLASDEDIQAFLSRVDLGVSANLCESLASLGGDESSPFDIRFTWSKDRPTRSTVDHIRFSEEMITTIAEAAREMRTMLPGERVALRGNVVRLARESKTGDGQVTIAGVLAGDEEKRLRKIRVSLSEVDYENAIRAHEEYREVNISGLLRRKGNRTELVEASGFALMRAEETDA